MSRRYVNYRRKKYSDWKDRVKKYLPNLTNRFYAMCTTRYIDYDMHKLLGRVILNINDPLYTFSYNGGENDEIALECLLEIQVNELFAFVYKDCKGIPLGNIIQ